MNLFEHALASDVSMLPLAERMRPVSLREFVGQEHLLGPGRALRRAIEMDRIPSMILWGPPGAGKTTLARIIAQESASRFEILSATTAGVKDVREVVDRARRRQTEQRERSILFIDEIHRFNKAQQDALLPHVERGTVTLVGATTENPSFEVNAALLSRARVFQLRELTIDDLVTILRRALTDTTRGVGGGTVTAADVLLRAIALAANGDARAALQTLEIAVDASREESRALDEDTVAQALGRKSLRYDKQGEEHYNVVSAFIKSMRASDADAAVYWLARMLEAGEDLSFVARRLVIFAAEDVGNAEPQGLVVAEAAAGAALRIGMPEAVLPLTQATCYLALAPKSNASLTAYASARGDVLEHGALPVPLSVRNAATKLMAASNYGVGYRYPHDTEHGVVVDHASYLPPELADRKYVKPSKRGWEARAAERLRRLRHGSASDDD